VIGPRSRAGGVVALALALILPAPELAAAAPRAARSPSVAPDADCGPRPAGASWFFLGAPGDADGADAARRALAAINDAFEGALPRDPSCLHVEVLDEANLDTRYRRFGRRGPKYAIAGFHNPKLGADSTVFVLPIAQVPLEIVIVHEVMHALSHRFSMEANRRRLSHMVEGATEYLTRELAAASLGVPKKAFRSGYAAYVQFYERLVAALGDGGLQLLAGAYLDGGYDAFENDVNQRLGISLREAARALEADDLGVALHRLSTRASAGR
jgi:hypothetical protein